MSREMYQMIKSAFFDDEKKIAYFQGLLYLLMIGSDGKGDNRSQVGRPRG